MTLLIYCRVGFGAGHWVRTSALAQRLAEQARVVIAISGRTRGELCAGQGIEIISTNGAHNLRELVHTSLPDALVIEYFPFGRHDAMDEIVPLLEAARETSCRIYCSLRDVQQCRRRNQEEFDRRVCDLANRYFNAILVHSDAAIFPLEKTFAAAARLNVEVTHTGYVTSSRVVPKWSPTDKRCILVSAGGGLGGEDLLRRSVVAYREHGLSDHFTMRVMAGANADDAVLSELQQTAAGAKGLEILRSVPDLPLELARAAVSVSRFGYNTALELVQTGVPALVVPYATPTEDEQTRRAVAFAKLGAVRWLAPERATPAKLAEEIRRTAEFRPQPVKLDLGGAENAANFICRS